MKLIIDGKLDTSGKVALDSGMFNACALINGKVVAQTPVSTNGEYKLELDAESASLPESIELKVYPASVNPDDAGPLALSKVINAARFTESAKGKFVVTDKLYLPIKFLDYIRFRTKKYHVHGTVYVENPTYFATLPGARIDFYEVDPLFLKLPEIAPLPKPELLPLYRRKDFLGSAYSSADGSYEFNFKFGVFPSKPWVLPKPGLPELGRLEFTPELSVVDKGDLFFDLKPDIRASIFLFINGVWTRVYDAPMLSLDWNIATDYHRDYRVPSDKVAGTVDSGSKPVTGFRFKTIGLLPVDNTRIVDGYAHSKPGDPVHGTITHEPFCDTLRIHGLFASSPVVPCYTVEILKTDATGTAIPGETWKPLGAPLTNLKWDDTTKRWEGILISDDKYKYKNIDIDPPMDWLEPSLKAVWNTNNVVNGYYKLKITGYSATNTVVTDCELPMIRIDNGAPVADFDVAAPAATVCGDLTLTPARKITFKVTAYEADGHLYQYSIDGSRGRYAESAGATVSENRPVADANWSGIINTNVDFAVSARSTSVIMCTTMAYSFHLNVQATGTDGVYNALWSRRTERRTNLVVTE